MRGFPPHNAVERRFNRCTYSPSPLGRVGVGLIQTLASPACTALGIHKPLYGLIDRVLCLSGNYVHFFGCFLRGVPFLQCIL